MLGCHPQQIQGTDPSLFNFSLSLEFPLIMCQLTQYSMYMHVRTQAHTQTQPRGTQDTGGGTGGPGEEKGCLGEDSWKTLGMVGWGQSIPFAPGSIDKPGSQLVQAEATPTTPLPSAPPFCLVLPWSSELGMVRAGMLKQVMFTCTSKAIKYKPPGLRWVCRPSHLGLTSWKHLASSCHNSIQVHFGLTQAPPLLVEVIPDYRATVVKCWYNVFFLFFFPSLCLYSCSLTAGHLAVLLLYGLLCAKLTSHFGLIYMKYIYSLAERRNFFRW